MDDSPSPSPFFTALHGDPRVTYIHTKVETPLGRKRNAMAQAAKGAVIVHFDDDDWYSAVYVERMLEEMRRSKASMVKLSGWFLFSCRIGFFGYFDPGETAIFGEIASGGGGPAGSPPEQRHKYSLFLDPRDDAVQTWVMGPSADYDARLRDETRYGFGFSYVYKRKLAARFPYNDSQYFGEDLDFVTRVRRSGRRVAHFADREGLALHLQGDWNTARIPTQYRLPTFLVPSLFGPAAANYTRCDPPHAP